VENTVSKKVLIGITALIALSFVAGCGDKKKDAPAGGGGGAAPAKTTAEAGPPATKGDAVIKGKVTFSNAPETPPKPIDMGAKADECGTKAAPKMDEWYVVGENNAAANVLVFVKSGPATRVKTDVPTTEIVFDQANCMYTPRVMGMRAGQPVRFKSQDNAAHNIHLISALNGDWNETMAAKGSFLAGESKSKKIEAPEFPPVKLKCDVHPWMSAFAGVFTHDYFKVTGKDGMYELKDLPPGDYEIVAWHERAKGKPQKLTIAAKETKTLDFALSFE
jgi:plastocyanin